MPNFKIIQDQPDEARVKVYGSNDVALQQDAANNLLVTSLLATTDVTYASGALADTVLAALTTPTQNVLALSEWSWIAYNAGTSAGALASVKMQGSPNGTTWIDNSSYVTVTQSTIVTMVPSVFLKYSRVYYSAAGNSTTSLNIFFQGQG